MTNLKGWKGRSEVSVVVVTGSGGLIGSEAVRHFHHQGFDVVGIDNDMRAAFFGESASTQWRSQELATSLRNFRHANLDVRDQDGLRHIFTDFGQSIAAVIHCAAQPSHDWAARDPKMDFHINALGTLNLLECVRALSPDAVFIHLSTNKVYGDSPNRLPLVETEERFSLAPDHPYAQFGIPESMSIDQSLHSLFGVSKASADLLVQEYGKYFGLKTAALRGGCLTGAGHSGAQLHGFLAYLVACAIGGRPYTVIGYEGKQVRDNIHSTDLVAALWEIFLDPSPGEVYNLGGSTHANVSVREAIAAIEGMTNKRMIVDYEPTPRIGDHQWYISDIRKFQDRYPTWQLTYTIEDMLEEMVNAARFRFKHEAESRN